MKLEPLLQQGLQTAGLALPPDAEPRLLEFLRLLEKWNRTYNLTAVRDPEQMVTRHLLDSLAVMPYVHGSRALDIGTGAGLPGIPLALVLPNTHFTLLDSNAKKTRFVTQTAHALGLINVDVVQTRVEKFQPAEKFTTLLTRAFASIPDMLVATRHLCAPGGRWLAMKGVFPQEELAAIPAEFAAQARPLRVPGLEAARHVVIIEPR